jgi:hypothetical protein
MPRRIRDDEPAPRRGKVPIRDIDGDALLALGCQTIEQQREVELPIAGARFPRGRGQRFELILEQQFAVVEQPADECRFAVMDRAASGRALP